MSFAVVFYFFEHLDSPVGLLAAERDLADGFCFRVLRRIGAQCLVTMLDREVFLRSFGFT
jgi:hypothetical protein